MEHHSFLQKPAIAMSNHHHVIAGEVNEPSPAGQTTDQVPAAIITKPAAAVTVAVGTDLDETDYSTSFADTSSSINHNDCDTISDADAESQLCTDVSKFNSSFDDFGTVLRVRKKRLTSHWRSFIRPLMWRCKWAELKIKQFESQALEYAKQIAAHNRKKHLASNQPIPEGFSSRSMPYTSQNRRRKLMKRRKRVRVEETADVDLYMAQHYLFSYHDSKKSDADDMFMMDDLDGPEQNTASQEMLGLDMHTNCSFLEDKDNDMEHLLQKIDMAHTRVQKFKAQLDLVISKNAPSFENLYDVVAAEEQTSAVHSPTAFSNSEFDMEGLRMSGLAGSNFEDGFHIPDVIESTVGTLLSVDVTQQQSHIGDSCENILDNMLVHDESTTEAVKHGLRNCQKQVTVKQEEKEEEDKSEEEEEESTHLDPAMESDTSTKDANPQEQSALKSSMEIQKNKRKRGERKAGPTNWNIQLPDDPSDS
ncbi:uncharacterized protein [Rutidosis leptorrhynchoides]|uniref:uncharacterized protein n=1 Tax=Rutidosis leptorrhynchoides TaxID=125765 RepID=UPI003A999981